MQRVDIKGMAHITGGGVFENLPRVLPEGLGAQIHRGSFPVPAIFKLIQQTGGIDDQEMFRVFNMGLGYILVLSSDMASRARTLLPQSYPVGYIMGESGIKVV